ncbi:hypothetical protein GT755_12405 [Herbidospora sp. NEAU-GS84]|uniref:Pentapeptide repeat-containing protein n=1 Tax=Herbidospora solisilvae TaxID=2696284 RepID=A0A7C9JBJ5_9ACTN|nr:pentapeptide repeat-containing protein [Herbidospora solisilvae]NAS22484.1 hypothetical protein [Herbidospora solisilvae]
MKHRKRTRITPPTQAELDELPAEKRYELHQAARQRPWQHVTTISVLLGLLFTAGGLVYTARTWETGQQTLETGREALEATQQQQITDRYAKAVEQLGNDKIEVRIGSLYALARIATDSPADSDTLSEVVVAFILERDRPADLDEGKVWTPSTDVIAAVRALRQVDEGGRVLGESLLAAANFRDANLSRANLAGAYLAGASLLDAYLLETSLTGANLAGANLNGADLTYANLNGADLTDADLIGANLTGADLATAFLTDADLNGADLTSAFLNGADLNGADLTYAELTGANLTGADLTGANLSGADLSRITGMTEQEIRRVATVDQHTKF